MINEPPVHIGQEEMEPDGFLQPKRYRVHYRCVRCGHEFNRVTTKLAAKDPPCPRKACKEIAAQENREQEEERLAQMLDERQAPAQVGHRTNVRAVDATAKIVMEDHGLTDLKDNIREGESMAPKLPHQQQQKADGFFGGGSIAQQFGGGQRMSNAVNALGRRALAGAFRRGAVNPQNLLPGKPGDPVLHHVRTERLG